MWVLLLIIAVVPFGENPYLRLSDSFLGIVPNFTVAKALGLVGLVIAVFRFASGRAPLSGLRAPQVAAFAAFIAWLIVAAMVSGAGLQAATTTMAIVLMLPLVLAVARTEAEILKAAGAAPIVLALIFPYGLRQMLRFGGRFGVALWDSNYLALAVVLLIPLPLVFFRHARTPVRKALWLGVLLTLILELALAGSRGGLLGGVVVASLMVLLFARRKLLVAAGAAGVIVLLLATPNPLSQRLLDERDTSASGSDTARLKLVQAGLSMAAANPLTGVGLGRFKTEVESYGTVDKAQIAHNTYLELAAELGLLAVTTFLTVLWATFRSLLRARRRFLLSRNRRLADLATGMSIGVAGFAVSATFLSAQFEKFFWLVVMLSVSLERLSRRRLEQARAELAAAA